MIELEGVPELVDPVMVAAFEGWNDAGDAASTAVAHLDREWKGEVFAALDAEDYYDFQVNRPTVKQVDGVTRRIDWPTTSISYCSPAGTDRDIVLRCLALDNDPADTRVSEVMSRAVVTARPGDSVQSAAALMAREQLRRLPVAENGRLVGMVTACDLARREKLDAEFAEAMRGISANLVRR